MNVGEPPGWDGNGLDRRRVLPGSLGSLTLLAVVDPCGHIAGGPRTGVGQPMEGGEHGGPVNQRYQRSHPPSGDVAEELHTADYSLLYLK